MSVEELPDRLARLVEAARADGSAPLHSFDERELVDAGWTALSLLARDPAAADDSLSSARMANVVAGRPPGPLADYTTLVLEHRRMGAYWLGYPLSDNRASVIPALRVAVLDLPGPDVAVVERADVPAEGREPVTVGVELVRCADLADELTRLAYRPAQGPAERAATAGTHSVFLGPDRKAQWVPTRLAHDWDAPTGVMVRWSYTLFGARTERDWVGRQPMTIQKTKPDLYRKHLLGRLGKRDPQG